MDDRAGKTDSGVFWTVQQFTTLPGGPWYSLHKQNDDGVQWGMTGYRQGIDAFLQKHRITAQELSPITEAEYYRRMSGDLPEEPDTRASGRVTWESRT